MYAFCVRIGQLEENHLQQIPGANSGADTSCDSRPLPPAGGMHMKDWSSFFVGKDCAGACYFVDIVQDMRHGLNLFGASFPRAYDELTSLVRPTDNDEAGS